MRLPNPLLLLKLLSGILLCLLQMVTMLLLPNLALCSFVFLFLFIFFVAQCVLGF